ncbi:hypothetical protein FGG08_004709 [Glutinoglossum americanum]|uniref:Integral membrane protein n=1 Tax=Glutinoglossum americanum TaxID=1670608 RepID=A0A9P8KWT6_9PEZI|nr:hypothetical protein FGG08_004709 [Glutinoglossum americanum]
MSYGTARKRGTLDLGFALLLALSLAATGVRGHEHSTDELEEGEVISAEPIIVRSKWHVPMQVVGTVLAIAGWFLGHKHKGRQFAPNIHAAFASSLMLMLTLQVVLGIYLKLHLEKGIHAFIRRYAVICHGVVGKLMPIVSWVQMLFGGITALGFCREDHLGQCLAHFIMGSAFIAYGILLTILLLVGQLWLKRTGRSQEFFDSVVIAAWGCVNTFTEHRWGGPWEGNDLQHTAMGIVWWCAGLVGIWLSRKRDGSPKRNLMPAIVILLTGYAMSAHPQHLMVSTMVHAIFGYTLMAAGLTRIIEISFVLRDRDATTHDGSDPNSFQYLTPFLLYASGFLFMGANEEQMLLVSNAGITHVSYILILYSFAFLLFLFVLMLLHLYAINPKKDAPTKQERASSRSGGRAVSRERSREAAARVRDAEEFELEGLMSEDELLDSPGSPPAKQTQLVS